MFNTWVSKSVRHYSSGMLLQDVTLFPVSMVAGKKTAWNVWEAFPEITDVLARLSLGSADIADGDITFVERFVVLLYGWTASNASVNGARCWLFRKKRRSIDNCPPTLNALLRLILFYFTKLASSSKSTPTSSRSKQVFVGWYFIHMDEHCRSSQIMSINCKEWM